MSVLLGLLEGPRHMLFTISLANLRLAPVSSSSTLGSMLAHCLLGASYVSSCQPAFISVLPCRGQQRLHFRHGRRTALLLPHQALLQVACFIFRREQPHQQRSIEMYREAARAARTVSIRYSRLQYSTAVQYSTRTVCRLRQGWPGG